MAKITRREALGGTAGSLLITTPKVAFGTQANSAVSFGIIGTGGRGRYVGTHMANDPRTRLVAICDRFSDRIDEGKTKVPGADKARAYKDYQELLNQQDIDAVLIATPVFLHPEHFEAAVKANKHIYCEKPAGADVAGVKRLMRAGDMADKSKTIQFGFQQRFSPEYLKAKEMVDGGKIGEMKMLMSFWILGAVYFPKPFNSPYSKDVERLRHWGRWTDLSGGPIVEQDCHGVDTLNFYAKAHPTKAFGQGGLRYPVTYGDWTSDHHNISYTYPDGVDGWLISIKHTAGYRDVKEQLFGQKAMIEVARTYYKLHGPKEGWQYPNADSLDDRSLIEKQESKREITIDAVEAFYTSIIEKKPINMAKDAGESTLTAILGRMAYEYEREVTWEEMLRAG